MSDDEYYIQDSRDYVGNDMLFWALNGNGYTTDMRKAQVYTKAEAVRQHEMRITDIPWPKAYIDAKTRPAVDMQYVRRAEALEGTGIELRKPVPQKPDVMNCHGCGRFINSRSRYVTDCPNCGADNRP